MSNLQPLLQPSARCLFVLIERMGVNIQRSGGLAVAEDACHRCHIGAACDHQAGGGMPERVDIQLLRQAVLFKNQLEAVSKSGGRHRELSSLPPEQEVIGGQFPLVIGFGDVPAFFLVLLQQRFHFVREVHIAVACAGLWLFSHLRPA